MLPPFIIDQIRKREDDQQEQRPVRQLPLPEPIRRQQKPADEEGQRGIVIIDLGGE